MSAWVAGAIVISAAVGTGAQIYAGDQASKATSEASKRTATTAQSNIELQDKMYQQTRTDNEAWRLAGEDALQSIQDTPDFQFTGEDYDFFADPSYQFRVEEGVNALDRSAASKGRLLSGAQDRAVTRFGQDMASQEFGNAFNRAKTTFDTNLNTQKSLANIGQQVAGQTQQAGSNMASNVANISSQSTSAQNALALANSQAQGNMATGIASSANQAIGNYLLSEDIKKDKTK